VGLGLLKVVSALVKKSRRRIRKSRRILSDETYESKEVQEEIL